MSCSEDTDPPMTLLDMICLDFLKYLKITVVLYCRSAFVFFIITKTNQQQHYTIVGVVIIKQPFLGSSSLICSDDLYGMYVE